jgi:hypothetical protein
MLSNLSQKIMPYILFDYEQIHEQIHDQSEEQTNTLEFMTTSYLEINQIQDKRIAEDIVLWNNIYENDQYNRLLEIELDYNDRSVHLRILSLDDLWPIYHICYWNLPLNSINEFQNIGKQYMKQGSMTYMFK